MVFTGTITTEADIALMAGENVDATGDTEANRNLLVAQAESFISDVMRYNIVDNYAGLNADVKAVFSEYAARYAAVALIAYNMAGFTSRLEAEDMINIHLFRMKALNDLFVDQKFVTYVKGA
jgi:hypothetical protein